MASNPPAECCTTGFKHSGEASGKMIQIDDIECYLSSPSSASKKGLVIFSDVLGHKTTNTQLIADSLTATYGYSVYVPDLFHGDSVAQNRAPGFEIKKWLTKHPTERVDAICQKVLAYMRDPAHGALERIGGIGYCFGGKYVVRFLKGSPDLEVGYIAHPSFVSSEEVGGIRAPISIAAAETDHVFGADLRLQTEKTISGLETAYKGGKLPWEIHVFSGVKHGFAVRGDKEDEVQKWAMEQAFDQAGRWFKRFL